MNWTQSQFDDAIRSLKEEVKRDTNPNDRRNLTGADPEPAPVRKYRNVTKEVDGIVFDSCKEAKVYLSLKYRQQAGEISFLIMQPRFVLQYAFRDSEGKKHREIAYCADFSYIDAADQKVVVECKGYQTPTWLLKKKLFLAKFPLIRLEIIR